MPEPAAPAYLTSTYVSKTGVRGGTRIAEAVTDLATHHERVRSPDGYRPERCPYCGRKPHGHGIRSRKLRDQPDSASEDIRRYRCRPCRAVWQVLPAFLARCLHRTWGAVQSRLVAAGALKATGAEWRVRSKPTTLARWLSRLETSAVTVTQSLVEAGVGVSVILQEVGIVCSRLVLIEALADQRVTSAPRKLQELACLAHRITPGLRLM